MQGAGGRERGRPWEWRLEAPHAQYQTQIVGTERMEFYLNSSMHPLLSGNTTPLRGKE